MLKETFPYKNIDGEPTVFTAHFNLTRFEVDAEMELENMQDRFQRFEDEVIGPDPNSPRRLMTGPEKREMLNMLKTIIRHAYGERHGDQIDKTEEIWNRFERTGAFSGYLYWLFDDPARANDFMRGIWPQDANETLEEAEARQARSSLSVVEGGKESKYEFMKNLDDYSDDYLLKCEKDEFDEIARHFKQGSNVPYRLIQLGMRRGKAD